MKTILVVEDEVLLLHMLRDMLEYEGYRVVTAADGEQGVEALTASKPDLVVSDIMMPRVGGLELARVMDATPELRQIPLILMSAGREPAPATHCAAFLSKPFNLGDLIALVGTHIGR